MNKIRAQITIRDNENDSPEAFARAINRFKRKIAKSGILRLYKDKRCYVKPSEIRHKKAQELKRKRKRRR
jgi:ribosomal protein S21